jgi:hypothetical protein
MLPSESAFVGAWLRAWAAFKATSARSVSSTRAAEDTEVRFLKALPHNLAARDPTSPLREGAFDGRADPAGAIEGVFACRACSVPISAKRCRAVAVHGILISPDLDFLDFETLDCGSSAQHGKPLGTRENEVLCPRYVCNLLFLVGTKAGPAYTEKRARPVRSTPSPALANVLSKQEYGSFQGIKIPPTQS